MSDLYERLKADLASRLPEGAAVRFSREEDSLFMTDTRRLPSPPPPPALWRVRDRNGLWFCTPEWAVIGRLCRGDGPPARFPAGPAGNFAALLYRYREEGEADAAFTLALLRTLGRAVLGQRSEILLPPLKSAYARCLADKKRAATAETALIALETARILEKSADPPAAP